MYDENSMKSHIFWIKFRRVFILILFTIIGTTLGVIISDYIVNILLFPAILRIVIVVISAVLFLGMALIFTANTGKEIEDGYWKIAVYKKLAIISKKLDNLDIKDNKETVKVKHKKEDSNLASHHDSQEESDYSKSSSKDIEVPETSEQETSSKI